MPAEHTGGASSGETVSWRRMAIGALEFVLASDGRFDIGKPNTVFVALDNLPFDDLAASADEVEVHQNALLIQSGEQWIVFETGLSSLKKGPSTGRLVENMAHAGIDPGAVSAIVPTHAHLDHIGGVMADGDTRNFPNAQIYLQLRELDFWLSDDRMGTSVEGSALAARMNLIPNLDRIVFHDDSKEILPGVHTMHTPGHTVGHTSFLISSGRDTLCVVGDIVHNNLQIERPTVSVQFDTDPAQAVTTRYEFLSSWPQIISLLCSIICPGRGLVISTKPRMVFASYPCLARRAKTELSSRVERRRSSSLHILAGLAYASSFPDRNLVSRFHLDCIETLRHESGRRSTQLVHS